MLGQLSTDCTNTECPEYVCYEECAHRTATYDAVQYTPFASQTFFGAYVDAWVKYHESLIQKFCEFEPDASELVAAAGLPERILIGNEVGGSLSCCETGICCNEIVPTYDDCIETAAIPNIAEMINAVKCVQFAGWDGVQSVLDIIGGEVLGVSNGAYNVSIPEEYSHLTGLFNLILPIPAGMTLKTYICKPNEFLTCLNN